MGRVLLVAFLGSCMISANAGKTVSVGFHALDTLEMRDTCEIMKDTICHKSVVVRDTVYHDMLKKNVPDRNSYSFRYDLFKEKMKEAWLGEAIRNVLR